MPTKRLAVAALFVLLLTSVGARDANAQVRAEGYGIVGPAFWTGFFGGGSTIHGAGGGEVIASNGVGAGGELGFFDYGFLVSANGSYHFSSDPDRKSHLFVTGGFTHVSADGSFAAWNIGAGVNHWTGRHVGVRFEVRDHIRPDDRGTVQYWSARGGIAIR